MNILFLTLVKIDDLEERGIYTDLLRKFREEGHTVSVVTPLERRENKPTQLLKELDVNILKVRTFNIQKTNLIEKGIGTLAIEYQYLRAIKKHFKRIRFDLVLYSTPPITFSKVIDFIKKRDNAYSYLLLKDIFPQNAVDMKMFKNKGILHDFFLKKERKLYELSDTIGCMSAANKEYIITHNKYLNSRKVEVNPNTIEPKHYFQTSQEKEQIKSKYGLPLDKKIFVYGGNLGKPQGLDFLLETIASNVNQNVFFLVVGSGTEYDRIEKWFMDKQVKNAKLFSALPKLDYDLLLEACDVGLIFLDKNFTIPNFPSRLLSYLEMGKPVVAATDSKTDIGKILEKNNCGFKVLSGDLELMNTKIDEITSNKELFDTMCENSVNLLHNEYTVNHSYALIKNKIKNV